MYLQGKERISANWYANLAPISFSTAILIFLAQKLAMKNWLLTFSMLCLSSSVFAQSFAITIAGERHKQPLDGRLLLLLADNNSREPRFQVNDALSTQMVFGIDVEQWRPGTTQTVDATAFGYPIERLSQIPAGDYYAQVVFHRYETFTLANGKTVKLPMDRGEGQHWNQAPGNLYSKPVKLSINPGEAAPFTLTIDSEIPPIAPPEDSKYVKHIRIKSEKLSAFWGRPMYLGAHVLLPEGFDDHPDVKYPLAIMHGHFPGDFGNWRTIPPDANLKPDTNTRFRISGYNILEQQEQYNFYKLWTGKNFPRVIAIEIQHATPYYDDSYAVNSASQGPWGDAITYELIPEIERRFRGIGQGWARFMYGGSTGGWEALAAQVFYPDEYNGCYAACPDPISFDHYTTTNIYTDRNAYYREGSFRQLERPAYRDSLGHVSATIRSMNHRELALGTNSRSGDQFDIWEATYSPMNADGYPQRIFDKYTGVINKEVAAYWKEHYDLAHIIQRDWPRIGEKLKGKIHIYVGEMDNYYLNNAVYSAEDVLKKLRNPNCQCEVDYGDRDEHCWNGDHVNPNYISRLRYHQMFITRWAEEVKSRAPKGADVKSWRY